MLNYDRMFKKISIGEENKNKKVKHVDFSVKMENAEGTMYVTDIQFQDGALLTGWEHNTGEMLTSPKTSHKRWYNSIIRGERAIVLPNEGNTMGYSNWTITADTDISPPSSVSNVYRGKNSFDFGMLFRTRNIKVKGNVKAGDVFKFYSNPMSTTKNGSYFGAYSGYFLGAPPKDMYYMLSIPGEQVAWDATSDERILPGMKDDEGNQILKPRTDKRMRVFIEVIPRDLQEGGKNL